MEMFLMALISGSASIRRYHVKEKSNGKFSDEIVENIRRFTFQEFSTESETEEQAGWVSIDDMFRGPLDDYSFEKNAYVTMSLRVDKKTVPARTLRAYTIKEETRYLQVRNRDKLTRQEKKDIREIMRVKLLKQALPSIAVYDFLWNLQKATLYFFSTSERANVKFSELFEKTFGTAPIKTSPLGLAVALGHAVEDILKLADQRRG
jgi:DNA recombination-dependent growth factor C